MKIVAILLVLVSTPTAYAQSQCPGRHATDLDHPHGANEIIQYRSRTFKQMAGRVVDRSNSPISNAVIDIYKCAESGCNDVTTSLRDSRERFAGWVTDDQGRFCLRDLPSGRYLLVVGTHDSIGFKMIYAPVLFDNHWWSRWFRSGKQLEITLEVGT